MHGTWKRWARHGAAALAVGLQLGMGPASAQAPKPAPPPTRGPAPEAPNARLPSEAERDLRALELLSRGATLPEVAGILGPRVKKPADAIRELKAGNARFFNGESRRPELNANQRRAQIFTQTPFAAILSCADSRVPTEIVYDQGLGDIFTTRVAGNIVTPSTAGSLEYAVLHLKPRVVMVMGHEGCGAVHAAMSPKAQRDKEPENVRGLLDAIAPAVEGMPKMEDPKARMREAVIRNVRAQVRELKKNTVIRDALKRGDIAVIGGFYEISSGAVDFIEDVADP